jgi:transcriptional regulator with XRE-family HTH domain
VNEGRRVVEKPLPDRPLRLWEVLRHVREREGLSQTQLGKRLGLSATTVSELERGVKPLTVRRAEQMAAALGCRIRWRVERVSRETDI